MVNTIVKNFAESGYVQFSKVPEDRRNKYVFLTENGKAYADTVILPLEAMEEKALAVLSEKERDRMLDMLERCYDGYRRLKSDF